MIRWTFIALSLTVAVMGKVLAAPSVRGNASIVLTSQENGLTPQQEFLCDGKIHGYIRLGHRAAGTHLLESDWIRPDGAIEAQGRTEVTFAPARSTTYIWFAFPERPAPGTLDPDSDVKRASYAGEWRVKVRWDGEWLLETPFSVRCPS